MYAKRCKPYAGTKVDVCTKSGVQLSVVSEKLNAVANRGRRKLSVVTNGATGKRSVVLNFYPYRTRISSHNLPLATVCIEYAVHMTLICTYISTGDLS